MKTTNISILLDEEFEPFIDVFIKRGGKFKFDEIIVGDNPNSQSQHYDLNKILEILFREDILTPKEKNELIGVATNYISKNKQ